MTAADDHCFSLVRDGDKDRFLASLFAPDERRPHLMALYAFNLEISRIRDAVSDPQLGLIRQQWWLDTLDTIYAGNPPSHPVAEALTRAVNAAQLPRHALQDLVTAREFDLYADPMPGLTELEAYLGSTSSALMQLAAIILTGTAAQKAAEATGLAGVAYGLSLVLRNPSRRGQYLPPGMNVAAAIAHARRRLSDAREASASLPPEVLPALLPATVTEFYLRRIEHRPDRPADVSQVRRQLTIWWQARRNRF